MNYDLSINDFAGFPFRFSRDGPYKFNYIRPYACFSNTIICPAVTTITCRKTQLDKICSACMTMRPDRRMFRNKYAKAIPYTHKHTHTHIHSHHRPFCWVDLMHTQQYDLLRRRRDRTRIEFDSVGFGVRE
jgi:hypothetical protein